MRRALATRQRKGEAIIGPRGASESKRIATAPGRKTRRAAPRTRQFLVKMGKLSKGNGFSENQAFEQRRQAEPKRGSAEKPPSSDLDQTVN
jgi:hypothetical protein